MKLQAHRKGFMENVKCIAVGKERAFPQKSHNHRLSRWLAQPYKGMVLAGLKAL